MGSISKGDLGICFGRRDVRDRPVHPAIVEPAPIAAWRLATARI